MHDRTVRPQIGDIFVSNFDRDVPLRAAAIWFCQSSRQTDRNEQYVYKSNRSAGYDQRCGTPRTQVSFKTRYVGTHPDRTVGASTAQFDSFCSTVRAGDSVGVALARARVARHVRTFITNTMTLATTGATEEVLAAFFYGREDIIPEMFRRLLKTLYGTNYENHNLRHFIYYIDRHIELDGDSHGPKGKELLEDLLKNTPDKAERAMRTACSSIEARIAFWDGTLGKLRDRHGTRSAAQA